MKSLKAIALTLALLAPALAAAQDARPTLRVALPALPASLDVGAGFSNPDHITPTRSPTPSPS